MTIPSGVAISEEKLKMIVAAKLFELGEVSSGQAAEMAGVSKREFLEKVGEYGVSIFGYDSDELRRDLGRP